MLDTWFSSALWPFATLGWPDDTEDLRYFYPGDLQTTAREIIRLWENRMIFCGLELLGEIPFRDVIIHSTVLAPDGRRMSKSLGTGIDPLEIIERYGTDATRYGLLKNSLTQDVRFSYSAIEEGAKLSNKLWNAARLIINAAEGAEPAEQPSSLEERWILARLSQTQRAVEGFLAEFDFAHVTDELYHLTFDDFCDWYLEAVKSRLYDGDAAARATATAALERLLALLHPVMPHVTEEIWSNLPARRTRLIVAPWPEAGDETEAGALGPVQEAAQVFRRSGVVPAARGRRGADLRSRRQARARPATSHRRRRSGARPPTAGDRPRREDARQRPLRAERPRRRGLSRAREARALPPRAHGARRNLTACVKRCLTPGLAPGGHVQRPPFSCSSSSVNDPSHFRHPRLSFIHRSVDNRPRPACGQKDTLASPWSDPTALPSRTWLQTVGRIGRTWLTERVLWMK